MNQFKVYLFLIIFSLIFSQEKEGMTTSGSMGSVTIDGKIYNQVAIRPEIPIGKLGLGLDAYIYFNDEGIYEGNWDFSSGQAAYETIIDKIYYIRWGLPGDNLYFKVGALPSATLGQGILVNNYSNIMEYPQIRRVGLDFKMKFMKQWGVEIIHSNFKKVTPGVLATRLSYDPFPRLSAGFSYVTDLDQNQGLRDRDGAKYPDYFDHFPDDGNQFSKALEEEIFNGWQSKYSSINNDDTTGFSEWYLTDNLDHNTFIPLGKADKDPVSAVSFDLVLRLSKRMYLYSQFAKLIGETDTSKTSEADLGYGIVPIGFASKLGPLTFRGEYRIQSANFVFSYWDQAYDLNRAITRDNSIITKESQMYKYGEMNGLYLNLNSNIMDLVFLDVSYQNMAGDVWDETESSFKEDANQTLMGKISLNTRKIAKLDVAEAFYQQSNVTNPFDFEPNEATISGYNLGFEVSAGMTLVYKNRTTYAPDGDGGYKAESSMQIETQIKF